MMASLSFDRQRYDQKMRTVGHYLKFIGTDAKTTERVNKFYDFRFSRKLMFSACYCPSPPLPIHRLSLPTQLLLTM